MKKLFAALLAALMLLAAAGCTTGTQEPPVVEVGDNTPAPEVTPEPGVLALTREYTETMGMVAAGYIHTVGLRTDGSAESAGHDYYGQRKVSGWTDVAYIAAGRSVTVGVKKDGTVVLAGSLTDQAAFDTAAAWTNVFTADAGGDFIAALLNDGTVVAAGDNSAGQCDVSSWSDIVAVACGDTFTLGLRSDGTVVGTAGAPADALAWTGITKLAAGGATGAAGITDEGKLVATCDMTGLDAYTDLVAVGVDDIGVACIRADGTVVSALSVEITPDPDYSYGIVELASLTNAVGISVGQKHVVVMLRDGTAAAYGSTDDLQCDVGRFALRPYAETLADGTKVIYGLQLNMTVGDAKTLIAAASGASTVEISKYTAGAEGAEGTTAPCADTDKLATDLRVTADGAEYGAVVIFGDVDCNGAVEQADFDALPNVAAGKYTGAAARAGRLETDVKGQPACSDASLELLQGYLAGTASIPQWPDRITGYYTDAYTEAVNANKDTVGYITIPKTNISYPIMFDATGKWYYNDHTFDKESADSGSIYAYYYGSPERRNTVFTGHNSRPSGTMFHQLHHIQEFNLGNATCAQTKYCGKELTNLPDLTVYSNRVWTVYLYGREQRWEVFAMYETEGNGKEDYKTFLDNIWWPYGDDVYKKETDESIQAWIDKQIELSQIKFDTKVTLEDKYLTVFTCGNEHDDSSNWARLYYFFKLVDE